MISRKNSKIAGYLEDFMAAIDLCIRTPFIATTLATKFAELNLVPYTVLLNGLESASAYIGTLDAKKFQKTYRMESLFKLATTVSNFWSFGVLVRELGKKYSFAHIDFSWKDFGNLFRHPYWKFEHQEWKMDDQDKFGAYGYAAGITALIALVCAVKVINRIHNSYQEKLDIKQYGSEDPQKQKVIEKEMTIGWERPFNQDYALFLNVAKLSLNIALAALSTSRLYFVANAALTAYTIYLVAKRKWLCLSRTQEWTIGPQNSHIRKVEYVYRCFLMPFSSPNDEKADKCTFCQEKQPDVSFHANHVFHERCLIKNFTLKTSEIGTNQFGRSERRTRDGNIFIDYDGKLPIALLPHCLNCREKPIYNELEVYVYEWGKCVRANINWIKNSQS